jgi:ribosome-associated protein
MPDPIVITRTVSIDASEIEESFVRSAGPGGQNVNKVSSAVQLRFDLANSASIPEAMKRRVATLAGRRLTKDGVIVIMANGHRDQPKNRQEAMERLVGLLVAGAQVPKARVATRPTLASRKRRLEAKSIRSGVKRMRATEPEAE